MKNKETLEIIIPVFNEEDCLGELMKRLVALKEKMNYLDLNIIFADDGSSDRSQAILDDFADKYDFVRVISLSRNFGHQIAITSGLDHADADYAVVLDADLQDPPELIEDMHKKAKEGYDVVYAKRLSRKGETFFKKFTAALFYRFISIMCDVEIPADTGDFRLISKRALKALNSLRERHRFIRGMVPWTGFKSAPIYYHRDERYGGRTKYSLRKMIRFAFDSIFSFSNIPLKIANYIGIMIIVLGVLMGMFLLYLRLFTRYTVPGITSVILAIIIMGGIQILMLGILGEYVGRIFEQSKQRPLYIIFNKKNFKEGA